MLYEISPRGVQRAGAFSFDLAGGLIGFALASDKHSRRNCETRFNRVVTAFADISTFILLLQSPNVFDVLHIRS